MEGRGHSLYIGRDTVVVGCGDGGNDRRGRRGEERGRMQWYSRGGVLGSQAHSLHIGRGASSSGGAVVIGMGRRGKERGII